MPEFMTEIWFIVLMLLGLLCFLGLIPLLLILTLWKHHKDRKEEVEDRDRRR